MNALLLLAEGNNTGSMEQIARTFGVDWTNLVVQIVGFCIVCGLLYRFAYRPVLTMLEANRRMITEGLAHAAKIKEELAWAQIKREEILKQANEQAAQLIQEAQAAAARVRMQETQRALDAAEQIRMKSVDDAIRAQDRMFLELKRELGRLVVQTVSSMLARSLTAEDQERLLDQGSRIAAAPGTPLPPGS